MKRCKFTVIVILTLCSVMILIFTSCQAKTKLSVSFDIGEYGTATGQLQQSGDNKQAIDYPKVTANEGYVFMGFDIEWADLPEIGKITIKAQYIKTDFWLVDAFTHERIYYKQVEIPPWEFSYPTGADLDAFVPEVEVDLVNMQTKQELTLFSTIKGKDNAGGSNGGNLLIPNENKKDFPISLWFNGVDNQYVRIIDRGNKKILAQTDSGSKDWNTVFYIDVTQGYNGEKLTTLGVNLFKSHVKVTNITLTKLYGIKDPNDGYWDVSTGIHAAKGKKLILDGKIEWQDERDDSLASTMVHSNDNIEYVVDRVYSNFGDEIDKDDLSLYAYAVSANVEFGPNDQNYFSHIQLTNKVDNGWFVEIRVFDKIDGVVFSNVFTLAVLE